MAAERKVEARTRTLCQHSERALTSHTNPRTQHFGAHCFPYPSLTNASDVFRFLRRNSKLYDDLTKTVGEISSNFGKFLVGEDGKVIEYYLPNANLTVITSKIEEILVVPPSATVTAQ